MASIVGRVNIAVALVPSLLSVVVVSPTRRPSPLSCPCSVHRHRAPLSITVESSSRRPPPSPLHLCRPSPSNTVKELSCRPLPLSCRRAVHCRHATSSIATVAIAVTVALSITIAPSIAVAPSITVAPSIAVAAVNIASRSRLPSLSRCRCTVHHVALPSRHPLPLPLHCRHAPFPLSSLVDCCLLTSPPLPSRLPSPSLSSALCHRHVVLGEATVVAVVVVIVLPSPPPPPSVAASRPC